MLIRRHAAGTLGAAVLLAITPALAGSAATSATTPSGRHAATSTSVLLDWQRSALRTVYAEGLSPVPVGSLYLGFTNLAVNDAVRWSLRNRHSSESAAIAVAAHDVLAEYFPTSAANLDADLATSLAAIPSGKAKRTGIHLGRKAADEMIDSRVNDGRNDTSIVYQRDPAPGVWQPPATGMLAPWLGYVDPLVIRHRVRVNGPDPITSKAYARDFHEVRTMGSATSTERTPLETETALFYNANVIAQLHTALVDRLEDKPISLARTARLLATVSASTADALIQAWRLKFEVGYWRPFQAIPGAGTDGNPRTTADPAWAPLIPTPPYSDYLSGHASATGSYAAGIRFYLGDRVPLLLTSSVTGTERQYRTLRAIEHDAFNARIWLGIHFRDAMEDGYLLAHQTAAQVHHRLR